MPLPPSLPLVLICTHLTISFVPHQSRPRQPLDAVTVPCGHLRLPYHLRLLILPCKTCSVRCARRCHSRSLRHPPRHSTSVLTHSGSCHCSCFLSTFSATPRLLQPSLDICISSSLLGMHVLRRRTSSTHCFPNTASRHPRALEQTPRHMCISLHSKQTSSLCWASSHDPLGHVMCL